ncbi:MAG: retropepsin-like aspartic protease [Chthoniobacter sp.]|uniref:retropepsin-like aspartic protease n=1 Tax=Chthoniobacter sp. TaxID=2510640 RepID=UPI0032AC8B9D
MYHHSLHLRLLTTLAGLLLASCASVPPPMPADALHPGRPPETSFDRGLGTDRVLCLRLQGERGDQWRFLVDSGSPMTIFDRSLRKKLGPATGTEAVQYAWSGNATLQVHAAPRLFLSDTLLLTGPRIWSDDLRKVWPGRGVDGILGLDCLRHYCVQLDFQNHTIRFLDPERTTGPDLGRAFPLYMLVNSVFVQGDLLGAGPALYQVDTGCTVDAVMKPPLFQKALGRQQPDWVRQFPAGDGQPVVEAGFPHGTFGGETYHKLVIDSANHNFLGLRFLARHVVTLNFPKHTMYLRRATSGG